MRQGQVHPLASLTRVTLRALAADLGHELRLRHWACWDGALLMSAGFLFTPPFEGWGLFALLFNVG